MASERISDHCSLSRRWFLEPGFARALVTLESVAQRLVAADGLHWPGLYVISGYRSRAEQASVSPGRPASPHTWCPAMAVDLRVGDTPASITPPEWWAFVGNIWKSLGGRWGGDFAPPDPNHFEIPTLGRG